MFVAYKASAGSGKTTHLVAEYLGLCLDNKNAYKNILAITFTNNATAEMKSRILDTLHEFAFSEEANYSGTSTAILGILRNEHSSKMGDFQQWAKDLLELIHYDFNNFSISTIDSFFQRILRAFSFELGLKSNFSLEIELNDVHQQTIDELLHKISASNKEISRRVIALVEENMTENGKWKIEKTLLNILHSLGDESGTQSIDDILLEWEKNPTLFADTRKELYQLKMIDADFEPLYLCLMKNLSQTELLADIKNIMEEIKERDNLFFLQETNQLINNEISDSETPFIFEKLGNKYHYFFIDEFQDTSKLQFQNIRPLLINALSTEHSEGKSGRVCIMGDVKQAIYRFRGGESELMHHLSDKTTFNNEFKSHLNPEEMHETKPLDTNYRSGENITTFNNEFFKYITGSSNFECCQDFYEEVKQETKNDKKGIVSVTFRHKTHADPDYLAIETHRRIEKLLQKGYQYQDIAILTSGRKTGSEIGNYLAARDIPVISRDSLKLAASQKIQLLIATLRFIYNSEDKIAQTFIIKYLSKIYNQNFSDCMQNKHFATNWQETLRQFPTPSIDILNITTLHIYTAIKELIRYYNLSETDPFLISLLEFTKGLSDKKGGDWSHFFEWWEEKGDAVTITTVHQSKGLSYPVVIFPFTKPGTQPTKKTQWVNNELPSVTMPHFHINLNNDLPSKYINLNDEEKNKTKLDNLNKIYVAHTRPKHELHIITAPIIMRGGSPYAKNIYQYLAIHKGMKIKEFEEEGGYVYYDGEWKKEEGNEQIVTSERVENKDIIEKIHCTDFTSYSKILNYPNPNKGEEKIHLGNFVHDFLSTLEKFPTNKEEITPLIHDFEGEAHTILERTLSQLSENVELMSILAQSIKIWNEQTIVNSTGEVLRPDKLVQTTDKMVVIDFKTGEEREEHEAQVQQYCHLLEAMGYPNVQSMVIYLTV